MYWLTACPLGRMFRAMTPEKETLKNAVELLQSARAKLVDLILDLSMTEATQEETGRAVRACVGVAEDISGALVNIQESD